MTKKKFTSARFGPRYGSRTRKRVAEIEAVQKRYHECPSCKYPKVKREAMGIWVCRKCGLKFAGGAWKPKGTTVSVFSSAKERILEEEAEFEKIFQEQQKLENEEQDAAKKREADAKAEEEARPVAVILPNVNAGEEEGESENKAGEGEQARTLEDGIEFSSEEDDAVDELPQ